jgi:asparaginyl-tRNA synthetase
MENIPEPILAVQLKKQIINIINDYREWLLTNTNNEYNKDEKICGWVRDFRLQSENAFISLHDGSTADILQIVCNKSNLDNFDTLENVRGACIEVSGTVIKSPAKGQLIEILAKKVNVLGGVDDKKSILLVKNVPIDTLRGYQHLRSRFRTFGYIYKIRSTLLKNIHTFFHANNFYNIDPNIITTSDCEGAGEVFTITTLDPNNLNNITDTGSILDIYKNDFFEKQAFLTVSSQLQLEALAAGLSRVYTLNPSFRAEKSKTKRHLACFTHLEWEIAFIDINDLMNFSEGLLKYVIGKTLKDCSSEYTELDKFVSKGIIEKLSGFINSEFQRISYDEAIVLVHEHKKQILKKFSKELTIKDIPNWGDDLGSYCERYISEDIYKKPTFVFNYPRELKSFYMKINSDGKTVQGVDLLIPGLGELIGSSIREENYEKLCNEMDRRGMDKAKLGWFVDLRRNSTFDHGGAGLGFDRLVNMCTLMDGNIRDILCFYQIIIFLTS